MRVMPLYIYFPKEHWAEISIAEKSSPEGDEVLAHYSEIYRSEFLKTSQFDEKRITVDGASGCRSNEKDSFIVTRVSEKEMRNSELALLTM